MITTALEAAGILHQHLQGSVLFANSKKPTGRLYLYQRLANSRAEDVVINSLTLNRATIQEGVLNVNVYVPNLRLSFDGAFDESQPDINRLVELATLTNEALKETWSAAGDYVFEVQQDNLFRDENNQHFINFRVIVKALNIPIH